MSIALDAPAAHTPSVMRSVSLRRKIRDRCVRSSVSSAVGSSGKRRKVSITIRLRRHATSGAGGREPRNERLSRDYREILRVEAAMPDTARTVGVSGMLHRTTVRGADLIDGTADWDGLKPGSGLIVQPSRWILPYCWPGYTPGQRFYRTANV